MFTTRLTKLFPPKAKALLKSYSGRSARTLSALCVTNLETGRKAEGVHEAGVFWRVIAPDIVDAVVARDLVMGSVRRNYINAK